MHANFEDRHALFYEIEGDDERSIKTLRISMYTYLNIYIHDFDMNIL